MALLAHRSFGRFLGAAFERRHYAALARMGRLSRDFGSVLRRYLTGKGEYPYECPVSTPIGPVQPTLYSYYDLLTLNEIFFRDDYPAQASDHVVVDIGSNIGLSGLYFLTRGRKSTCYLFEPDPQNFKRLQGNLMPFRDRFHAEEKAVSDKAGRLRFGQDTTSGRYGGLDVDFGTSIQVDCLHINSVLESVLNKHERIDILKIDTEGSEITTLSAANPALLRRVGRIYMEAHPDRNLLPGFSQSQSGTVCRLKNNLL